MASEELPQRSVTSTINLTVTEPAELIFSVAVGAIYSPSQEWVNASVDGRQLDAEELVDAHGTRLHRVHAPVGEFRFDYSATVPEAAGLEEPDPTDLVRYLRPSRYAESDSLGPTAGAEFSGIKDAAELLHSVSSWVGTRLFYVSGSSLPTDGAVRTLLSRQGVCRDFAHLTVGLLRALNVPARMASVYAPGLYPMDFHAVAEAYVDGGWYVVDATTLAPRQTLVRIATGRDAADTAFLTVTAGRIELGQITVTAVSDTLPFDDVTKLVALR
jgi:transglutaminase-like putative cysteine protease